MSLVVFDQCMFLLRDPESDIRYLEHTRVIGSSPKLSRLGRNCDGKHHNQYFQNTIQFEGRNVNRSFVAEIYPALLCALWMGIVSSGHPHARRYSLRNTILCYKSSRYITYVTEPLLHNAQSLPFLMHNVPLQNATSPHVPLYVHSDTRFPSRGVP